jgi:hypothetical protein
MKGAGGISAALLRHPGIREHDIEPALLALDLSGQTVEIAAPAAAIAP